MCSVRCRLYILFDDLIFRRVAYHAVGATVTRDSTVDLTTANLARKSERVKKFICVIKLCSILPTLQNVIGGRELPELVPIDKRE